MRIVQTFWSCKRELTQNSFGWLSPQDHIMGWALSCLKLKEQYDDLHLYTDSNGIAVLIDYLGLPYKTATPCHDNINQYCKYLWALPKIMTFAAQNEPFIHVDGDVFIWEKFSNVLENADLIAQNFEEDTGLYRRLMDEVLETVKNVPDFLKREVSKDSISSYNMGIFGGKDIAFIKNYCKLALDIVNANHDTNAQIEAPLNFNLLFEQILFYTLTDIENKEVTCFSTEKHNSEKYTIGDYADFTSVPHRLKYLHLLGGHKRNAELCDLMRRTLLKEYPDYYYKIIALFKDKHTHFEKKIKDIFPTSLLSDLVVGEPKSDKVNAFSYPRTQQVIFVENNYRDVPQYQFKNFVESSASPVTKNVFQFESQLASIMNEWEDIPGAQLHETEKNSINYFDFLFKSEEEQLDTVFERNHYLEIIEDSYDWEKETKTTINPYLINQFDDTLGLAFVPRLFFEGYREVIVDEINYNILAVLNEPISLRDLLPQLKDWFTDDEEKGTLIYDLVLMKLRFLLRNQCVFIKE